MAFADAQDNVTLCECAGPTMVVTLTGLAKKGDALTKDFARALATTGTATPFKCVALQDGNTGDRIRVGFGKTLIKGRITGGTPGGLLYLAEGTAAGQYTDTVPTTSGDINNAIGYVIDTDTVWVDPLMTPDSTV